MPFLLDSSEELTPEMICSYIKLHTENTSARYKQLQDYYEGKQKILMRTPKRADDPCNNVVANFAKYITDIASGYQMGEPVSYQSDSQDLTELLDWYNTAQMDWDALWRGSNAETFWFDLYAKHTYWINAFPSTNPTDYVDFHLEEFATDLAQQVIEKVIVPNVDPHPEEYGHVVMKRAFTDVLGI